MLNFALLLIMYAVLCSVKKVDKKGTSPSVHNIMYLLKIDIAYPMVDNNEAWLVGSKVPVYGTLINVVAAFMSVLLCCLGLYKTT